MKTHGLFGDVHDEVCDVIVAEVSAEGVRALLAPDQDRLNALIQRVSISAGRRRCADTGMISLQALAASAGSRFRRPAGSVPTRPKLSRRA